MRSVSLHSGVRVLVLWFYSLTLLSTAFPIEVHEDVNESPIGVRLQLNSTGRPTDANQPPIPIPAMVNERNVNDPPPPTPYQHSYPSTDRPTGLANNFTFPSNHKQHSGATGGGNVPGGPQQQTSSPLTTEVVTVVGLVTPGPTSVASITSYSTPMPPSSSVPSPATTTGLSSFRAANGHLYTGPKAIVSDRSVQHQISGYRKRQLYASAAPGRNTNGSSDGQFSKEFVPSPEVIPFFNVDSSAPGSSPTSGTSVDAPYPPGVSEGDSRWYAGAGLSSLGYAKSPSGSGGSEESNGWNPKYTWTAPSQRLQQQNVVKFPPEQSPPFPSPKGKWKWIPEEDEEPSVNPAGRRPAETTFSSSGSLEEQQVAQHHFGYPTSSKGHPYSFDRTPNEATFSIDPGATVTGVSVNGSSAESTETNGTGGGGGTTDVKLVGKEDAHHRSVSPWKKIIHVLSAAIPIGLLISALTPQVVYINPNATLPPVQLQTPTPVSGTGLATSGIRQRSLTGKDVPRFLLAQRGLGTDPVALVKLLRKLNALERSETDQPPSGPLSNRLMADGKLQGCDWWLLCRLAAHQGMSGLVPGSDPAIQKMLWKIVNETPVEWTGRLGLEDIFRTIRDGDCARLRPPHTCDQDT